MQSPATRIKLAQHKYESYNDDDDCDDNHDDTVLYWGRAVVYRLRHYATNRQVVGSIPDGVNGISQ